MTRNTKVKYVLAIIFWILTIMILSCTFVFAQTYNDTNKFTDRQRDGFLGPVKSVCHSFLMEFLLPFGEDYIEKMAQGK